MRMLERLVHEEDGAATAEYVIATMAAVGFAGIVQFFATAVNIGLMIAAGALVGKTVGAHDPA